MKRNFSVKTRKKEQKKEKKKKKKTFKSIHLKKINNIIMNFLKHHILFQNLIQMSLHKLKTFQSAQTYHLQNLWQAELQSPKHLNFKVKTVEGKFTRKGRYTLISHIINSNLVTKQTPVI